MSRRPVVATVCVGVLAALLCGYAWYRTLTFDRPTGPRTVAWYDAGGALVDTARVDRRVGDTSMHDALVLGDRLIVSTDGPARDGRSARGGFAWIAPSVGQARIAWPLDTKHSRVEGAAVRDPDTFALMLHTGRDTGDGVREYLAVAIAGRDGWLRPPEIVVEWTAPRPGERGGRPLLLGMSWVDGELEAVLTHPSSDDVHGSQSPPDIVRVPVSGARTVRSHALGCTDCSVYGALPGPKGWTIIVHTNAGVRLSDGAGGTAPAPPALAWWSYGNSDRAALGTLWAAFGFGEPRVERDGSRSEPAPPIAGWTQLPTARRLEWIDGVLRSQRLWARNREDSSVLAQWIGGRTIVTASDPDADLQLVGFAPDALRPTIYNTGSSDFRIGTFLPRRGGGYYWVDGDGDYVTLDDQLRRLDPLPLRHHLRTRGSASDSIDEPEHELALRWALFGLPILGLVGLVVARRVRDRLPDGGRGPLPLGVLIAAFGVYVITGGLAFLKVLPML